MIDNVIFMGIVCLVAVASLASIMAGLIVHGGCCLVRRAMRRRKRTDGGK